MGSTGLLGSSGVSSNPRQVPPPTTLRQDPTPVNPRLGKDGLAYIWIPPGTFTMGCSGEKECEDSEKPAHQVSISKGFWIGQTEVTQTAYQRISGQNPSLNKGAAHPVDQVSWFDAKVYCESVALRLPTEAEWEFAARAGSEEARYGALNSIAWQAENANQVVHDVGLKNPNAWNLYDMLGNVFEWTADWYDAKYYRPELMIDPQGPADGASRVLRGGAFIALASASRVSTRIPLPPSEKAGMAGFRCAGTFR